MFLKSVLIPHSVMNSMGCLAEIPPTTVYIHHLCRQEAVRFAATWLTVQLFSLLFTAFVSFPSYTISALERKKILPKQSSVTYFWNQNKIEQLLTTNPMSNGRMELLFLVMRVPQHQKAFTEGGVSRDGSVHCLPQVRKLGPHGLMAVSGEKLEGGWLPASALLNTPLTSSLPPWLGTSSILSPKSSLSVTAVALKIRPTSEGGNFQIFPIISKC